MESNTRGGRIGQGQPEKWSGRDLTRCSVAWLAEWFGLNVAELGKLGVRDTATQQVGITYRDQAGIDLFVRKRVAMRADVRFHQPEGCPLRPYGLWRLDEARKAGYLIIVEGESDCWVLWHHGFPALGLPGSGAAGSLRAEDVEGIPKVYVSNERDLGADLFIAAVPKTLRERGYADRIFELTMPEGHKDPAEVHRATPGHFRRLIEQAMADAKELHPSSPQPLLPFPATTGQAGPQLPAAPPIASKEPELPSAERLLQLVLADGVELFKDEDANAYVRLPTSHQRRTVRVTDTAFIDYLGDVWERAEKRILTPQTEQSLIKDVSRRARKQEPPRKVYTRCCTCDGKIYIDLADSNNRSVEITRDGWRVINESSVLFYRPDGARPLPAPIEGGELHVLWDYVNVTDPGQQKLFLTFLLCCCRGQAPYPLLLVTAGEDSGKSTMAQVLKQLIDPHNAELLGEPTNKRDLFINAMSAHLLVFNNVSKIDKDMSDSLCRVTEGAQEAVRTLFTTAGQTVLRAQNPVAITTIEDVLTRPDLLSRALIIHPSPMAGCDRKAPGEFWAAFEADRPRLLGALFDALVRVLQHIDNVEFDRSFRMADYAKLGAAAERALGWEPGSFGEAYRASQAEADAVADEAAVWGQVIYDFLSRREERWWKGTASELLKLLRVEAGGDEKHAEGWPKLPHHLTGRLKSHAGRLVRRGIQVEMGRDGDSKGTRFVRLTLTD